MNNREWIDSFCALFRYTDGYKSAFSTITSLHRAVYLFKELDRGEAAPDERLSADAAVHPHSRAATQQPRHPFFTAIPLHVLVRLPDCADEQRHEALVHAGDEQLLPPGAPECQCRHALQLPLLQGNEGLHFCAILPIHLTRRICGSFR